LVEKPHTSRDFECNVEVHIFAQIQANQRSFKEIIEGLEESLFLRNLGKTGVHSTDNYTCSYRFFYGVNSVMEFSGNIVNSM
jgi:hypothetical protein